MKVIQPFFLGGGIGLVLALGLAAACFLSPLRKGLYLDWDPEVTDLRDRMHAVREQAVAAELGIAAAAAVPTRTAATASPAALSADSLKRVQAGAWKEYRHWRNRLGELSRHHDRATPAGFAHWTWSMRLLTLPTAALLSLAPALLLAWRGVRRTRLPKVPKPPKLRVAKAKGKSEAMTSFESAVRQVARIAAASPEAARAPEAARPSPDAGKGAPEAHRATEAAAGSEPHAEPHAERGTEYLPEVPRRIPVTPRPGTAPLPEEEIIPLEPSPYEMPPEPAFRVPETKAIPMEEDGTVRPEGIDTQIMKLGPEGWGEARRAPADPAAPARPAGRETLSMEDEDGDDEDMPLETGEPPPGAFMPPTTEVERVERRKAEVLKLARKGLTSSEISRRMRISQDQVEFIIRMRREKG